MRCWMVEERFDSDRKVRVTSESRSRAPVLNRIFLKSGAQPDVSLLIALMLYLYASL